MSTPTKSQPTFQFKPPTATDNTPVPVPPQFPDAPTRAGRTSPTEKDYLLPQADAGVASDEARSASSNRPSPTNSGSEEDAKDNSTTNTANNTTSNTNTNTATHDAPSPMLSTIGLSSHYRTSSVTGINANAINRFAQQQQQQQSSTSNTPTPTTSHPSNTGLSTMKSFNLPISSPTSSNGTPSSNTQHQSNFSSGGGFTRMVNDSSSSSDKTPLLSNENDDSFDSSKLSIVGGIGSVGVSTYYEQYESTVNKIRTRRSHEAAEKLAKIQSKTPEQTRREMRTVGILFTGVLIIIGVIIFILYPRIPAFDVHQIDIKEMRLWSDGYADFCIRTTLDMDNSNFLSTGITTLAVDVLHNNTALGTSSVSNLKLSARHDNRVTLEHDLSNALTPDVFSGLFNELSTTAGQLTLTYVMRVVTSENFRLRNIHVDCETIMQIQPMTVPPTAQVMSTDCTHSEQTG